MIRSGPMMHLSSALDRQQAGPSFSGLMELYESNYLFLRRLLPDTGQGLCRVSPMAQGAALHAELLESTPYTRTYFLTHQFAGGQAPGAEMLPALRVRIYYDARVAEVVGRGRHGKARDQGPSLAWRWRANRFLNRWLRFCLGEGHRFESPAT